MLVRNFKQLFQRRKSKRHIVSSYVGIYDLDSEEFIGHLTNLSRSGMMVTGTKALEPSQTYHLGIQSESFAAPENLHPLEAKCLWAKQELKDELFTSGFIIDKASRETKKLLAAC